MSSEPPAVGDLQAYHFYERDWDSYETLRSEFEWEIPSTVNIAQLVCDRHESGGNAVGMHYEDERGREGTYSFEEMRTTTDQLAHYLTEAGLSQGDRAAVCIPQKPETVLSHVGIWKTGSVSIPLSTLYGPDALRYRLENSDARVAIVDETNLDALRAVRDDLPALEEVLVVGDADVRNDEISFWEAIRPSPAEFDTVETAAADPAVLIYTSGTTGDPKGVLHAHNMLLGQLPGFICIFCNGRMAPEDVFWVVADWAWKGSLFDFVFPALFYGKPVLAYEGYGSFDPETAFELVDRYDLTSLYIPPTALRGMMTEIDDPETRFDTRSVRVLGSGGEALGTTLPRWVEDVFGATVHEGYGQTEASPLVGNCSRYFEYKRSIGKPLPGIDVTLLDPEDQSPVPPGETGEIAVETDSPNVFQEYWDMPKKTAETFHDGLLLTDDLAVEREDGYLDFVGRKDDVIISSGYRIGPEVVEDAIANHNAVADAGVIGVPDEQRGSIVKAYVTLTADATASAELRTDIQNQVRERLAKYEYPREIEFIDSLPTTTTGKIRRTALRDRHSN